MQECLSIQSFIMRLLVLKRVVNTKILLACYRATPPAGKQISFPVGFTLRYRRATLFIVWQFYWTLCEFLNYFVKSPTTKFKKLTPTQSLIIGNVHTPLLKERESWFKLFGENSGERSRINLCKFVLICGQTIFCQRQLIYI